MVAEEKDARALRRALGGPRTRIFPRTREILLASTPTLQGMA
jgi:hypothetical protein